MAAMWRANDKVPQLLDAAIRDHAVRNEIKLRSLVEEMIDEGAEVIRRQGVSYVFQSADTWQGTSLVSIQYVISAEYRNKVESLTAAMTGSGKLGKALAETLYIASQNRNFG